MDNEDMGRNDYVRVRVSAEFKEGWVAAAHFCARSESQALIEAMEMWLHSKGWAIEGGAPVKPGVYPAVEKEPPSPSKTPSHEGPRKIRISGPRGDPRQAERKHQKREEKAEKPAS